MSASATLFSVLKIICIDIIFKYKCTFLSSFSVKVLNYSILFPASSLAISMGNKYLSFPMFTSMYTLYGHIDMQSYIFSIFYSQ